MGDKKRGNRELKKPKKQSDGTKKQKKDPKRYDGRRLNSHLFVVV